MHVAVHTFDFSAGAPDWVHLLPAGIFRGQDGRGPYSSGDAAAVIAASMQAQRLPVDENHATDHAMTSGVPSPARGWIVEMQGREDGIWGRVEWNDSGRALMTEKAYRGISPVFTHTKSGTVVRILRAALTNTPNLTELATLHSESPTVDLDKLRAHLKLPATAGEAEILAAIDTRDAAIATHATRVSTLEGELSTARSNGDPSQLATEVTALQGQLNELRETRARDAATIFVDAAIKSGKPIVALREHYIARHMADADAVRKEVEAMISLNASGAPRPPAKQAEGGDDELSQEEMSIAKKMGLDPKAFARNKAEMAKRKAA